MKTYIPALIVFIILFAIIGVFIVSGPNSLAPGRKDPTCADCVRHCEPFRVIKCVPSGLGPRCECAP